jgi:hypothetical protein
MTYKNDAVFQKAHELAHAWAASVPDKPPTRINLDVYAYRAGYLKAHHDLTDWHALLKEAGLCAWKVMEQKSNGETQFYVDDGFEGLGPLAEAHAIAICEAHNRAIASDPNASVKLNEIRLKIHNFDLTKAYSMTAALPTKIIAAISKTAGPLTLGKAAEMFKQTEPTEMISADLSEVELKLVSLMADKANHAPRANPSDQFVISRKCGTCNGVMQVTAGHGSLIGLVDILCPKCVPTKADETGSVKQNFTEMDKSILRFFDTAQKFVNKYGNKP